MAEQLKKLRDMRDDQIDFSDIPPTTPDDWRHAVQRKALERVAISSAPLLAARHLTLIKNAERKEVLVEIGPLKDHESCTSCHVHIHGDDGEIHQDIYGVDGVQALVLAMKYAGVRLDIIGKSWELSSSGEKGHGFEAFPEQKKVS